MGADPLIDLNPEQRGTRGQAGECPRVARSHYSQSNPMKTIFTCLLFVSADYIFFPAYAK